MGVFVGDTGDFTAVVPDLSKARVSKLKAVDRDDDVKRPGRPAMAYMAVEDSSEDVDFGALVSRNADSWWLVYSIERAATADPVLVLLEIEDKAVQEKIYYEEAFLDRGVRIHVPLGASVAVVSVETVEEWLQPDVRAKFSKVSFVANTGRCGSTLFHKLLLWTGKVVSLSEPQWCDVIGKGEAYNEASCEQLTRAAKVCVLLDFYFADKAFGDSGTSYYSLNPKGGSPRFQLALYDAFPESKHVFMYRACHKVVESFGSLGVGREQQRGGPPPQQGPPPRFSPIVERVEGLPEALSQLSSAGAKRNVNGWLTTILGWCEPQFDKIKDKFVMRMDEFVGQETKHKVVRTVLTDFLHLDDFAYDPADADDKVFAVDSQKGSNMSRRDKAKPRFLTDADLDLIQTSILPTAFKDAPPGRILKLDGQDLILKGSAGVDD